MTSTPGDNDYLLEIVIKLQDQVTRHEREINDLQDKRKSFADRQRSSKKNRDALVEALQGQLGVPCRVLSELLEISRVACVNALNDLIEQGKVEKKGTTRDSVYRLKTP